MTLEAEVTRSSHKLVHRNRVSAALTSKEPTVWLVSGKSFCGQQAYCKDAEPTRAFSNNILFGSVDLTC